MKPYKHILCAGLVALGTGAAGQARMDLYLNGQSTDGAITFSYASAGCTGTLEMTQRYENGAERTAVTEFSFGELTADGVGFSYAEAIDITMLNFALRDGAAPLRTAIELATTDAALQEAWQSQGADCRDDLCTISIEQPAVQFVVSGPNSDTRAEFVLQDIRALTTTCMATE